MTGNKGCVNTSVGAELPDSKRPSLRAVKLRAIGHSAEQSSSAQCPRFEHRPSMTCPFVPSLVTAVSFCLLGLSLLWQVVGRTHLRLYLVLSLCADSL